MYLIDTNVWLERLLHQEHSDEIGQFLSYTPSERLFTTDFSLHSIGIVMHRLKRLDALLSFIQDVFIDGAVALIHLGPEDMYRLVRTMDQYNLDFDDAYQYVAAEKYDLTIVSLDSDFDRTEKGR
ncbi:MAG: type II toxin-antitoxin system VapC family toxin, partial [Chloroflexi bacterium]|nr:type II toxin-antitoxin system VapC family toxin [Chloroflexota bacterium]